MDMDDLYQEMILDHYKNPRNKHVMENSDYDAKGHNPLCGDNIQIFLHMNGDIIEDISFEGSGCAISQASASLLTELLKGKDVKDANHLFDNMHDMLTGNEVDLEEMGKLAALSGVSEFPMRVKCATLAWHTMKAALEGKESISTE